MDYDEYKLIREGLLALLCVGDKINCVYTMYREEVDLESDELIPCESYSNTIRHYTVAEISGDDTLGIQRDNHPYKQPLDRVYAYEGQLYIYNYAKHNHLDHWARLKKVIYVIELLKSEGNDSGGL
jgi:hypothetical protein